jgi:hypothetical protein
MHYVSFDGIQLFVLTHTSHSTAPYASIGRIRSLGKPYALRRGKHHFKVRNPFHSTVIRSVTSGSHDASYGLHGSKNKSKKGQSLPSFARPNSLVTKNAKSVTLRPSSLSLSVSRMLLRVLDMQDQRQKQKQEQKQRNETKKAMRSPVFSFLHSKSLAPKTPQSATLRSSSVLATNRTRRAMLLRQALSKSRP